MFAKWLRLGLTSGRITTSYPDFRSEVIVEHRLWKVLPNISTVSLQKAQTLVNNCPTQALTLTADAENFQLSFDRGACIACGRCMAGQPEEIPWDNEKFDLVAFERQALVKTQAVTGGDCHDERR